MFDEIKKDTHRKPLLTYVIAALCIIITALAQLNEDLFFLFGNHEGNLNILKIFILPFPQGFDWISSLILLVPLLFFWIEIGGFVEKVMGPERFTLLITSAFIFYGSIIFVLGQPGHGLSPLIFASIPVLYIIMRESASIKMANTYTTYYRYFQVLPPVFIVTTLVIFSFLPIYFDYDKFNTSDNFDVNQVTLTASVSIINGAKDFYLASDSDSKKRKGGQFGDFQGSGLSLGTMTKGFLLGNLPHFIGFFVGVYYALRYRKRIGGTLTRFNRRSHLSEKSYKPIYIFTGAITGYLIILFILNLFIEL